MRKLLNKELRYDNHLFIFNTSSTPSSLAYDKFPKPFFEEDQEFLKEQNKIIEEYQEKTINLIKQNLEKRIEDLKSKISEEKDSLINKSFYNRLNFNIDDITRVLIYQEETKLKNLFIKNKFRAEK